MNIYIIDIIDINICSDSEIYENENTFTASYVPNSVLGARPPNHLRIGQMLSLRKDLLAAAAYRLTNVDFRAGKKKRGLWQRL